MTSFASLSGVWCAFAKIFIDGYTINYIEQTWSLEQIFFSKTTKEMSSIVCLTFVFIDIGQQVERLSLNTAVFFRWQAGSNEGKNCQIIFHLFIVIVSVSMCKLFCFVRIGSSPRGSYRYLKWNFSRSISVVVMFLCFCTKQTKARRYRVEKNAKFSQNVNNPIKILSGNIQ